MNSSTSGIPPGWDSVWVTNSFGALVPVGDFTKLLYFEIAISGAIILHSWTINKWKFRILRACTEISAFCTILQAALYLYCTDTNASDDYSGNSCSIRVSAYLFDVLGEGVASTVIQICDNFVVFHRYVVLTNDNSLVHRIFLLAFVIVILFGTYWPFYTVFPWFMNMNTASNTELVITYLAQYVLFPAYAFYDLFYSLLVLRKLWKLMHNSIHNSERQESFQILAFKTIVHNLLSIGAIGSFCFYISYGIITYNVVLTCAMHFCFNWKFEKYFKKASVLLQLSSSIRALGTQVTPATRIYRVDEAPVDLGNVQLTSAQHLLNDSGL